MNAERARNLLWEDDDDDNDLGVSVEDSCDEDEFDLLEVKLENDENEEEGWYKILKVNALENEVFQTPIIQASQFILSRSETVEMLNSELLNINQPINGQTIISGRYNKKKTNVIFNWFSKPNMTHTSPNELKARVFEQILN